MTYPERPDRPEIPYPFPPFRDVPRRTDPVLVPMVAVPDGDPGQRLFERRIVLVSGALDHDAATMLCAQLMALDGQSSSDVEVLINSPGGPADELAAVLDVIELMRARVNTSCVGTARGTAGIVVACGTGRRRAGTHATISVRCDRSPPPDGTADDVARAAVELEAQRRRLRDALVAATGLPADVVAGELDHGAAHGAAEALALGLVDEIGRPPSR
jgi:ATP-dependent Clp protease, protease subunit